MTTTFPKPCHIPIDFALVLDGMASQSIKPNLAEAGQTSSIINYLLAEHGLLYLGFRDKA